MNGFKIGVLSILIAAICLCSCEDTDSDQPSASAETNAPPQRKIPPPPPSPSPTNTTQTSCVPTNYVIPQPPVTVTSMTETASAYDSSGSLVYTRVWTQSPSTYSDGSRMLSEQILADIYIYFVGTNLLSHWQDITEKTEIVLFDTTRIKSQLFQRFYNDAQEKYEFSASVECPSGEVYKLTEAEFATLKRQLGL